MEFLREREELQELYLIQNQTLAQLNICFLSTKLTIPSYVDNKVIKISAK